VFQVIESRNIPDWKEFLSVKEKKQTRHLWCKLSTKGQNQATKELGKRHFRTASLDLIYKTSSLYHLHGTFLCRTVCEFFLALSQSQNWKHLNTWMPKHTWNANLVKS
jgi:hypothetical protein